MNSFEQFRQELRDALTHLHDPDYCPSAFLCAVLSRDPAHAAGPLQTELIQIIRDLEPLPDLPPDAQSRRDFDLLFHRYVLKLTQEETAERLHLSVRSVRRVQRAATHTLARLLWEHSLAREASAGARGEQGTESQPEPALGAPGLDWRTQVRQDLASLQAQGTASCADVKETIRRVVALERALVSRYGIALHVDDVQSGLMAAVHPSALRQVLVLAIGQLARYTQAGEISISARRHADRVVITLATPAPARDSPPGGSVIREILDSQGGALETVKDGDGVSFYISVPSAGPITVLVVDDNLDQVHFYRRCTAGTRYRIVHAAQGMRTVQAIQATAPDVIVLDILMPEIDGWELLADLRNCPDTASIPVIICSIIAEESLAELLGATLYLPKPVHHTAFIQALAEVLDPGAATGLQGEASNAAKN